MDEWYSPSVAYAGDIVVLATSQQALEQMILDLTDGFEDLGPEIIHGYKRETQKVAWTEQANTRRDVHGAERELSSIGTAPHEALSRNLQKMAQKVLCCPYLVPSTKGWKRWQKLSGQM